VLSVDGVDGNRNDGILNQASFAGLPYRADAETAGRTNKPEVKIEMGKNAKCWVRVRFEFIIDGIGKMFPWYSSV